MEVRVAVEMMDGIGLGSEEQTATRRGKYWYCAEGKCERLVVTDTGVKEERVVKERSNVNIC